MSPCGYHSPKEFTSDRTDPGVVEDDSKTFPECSSSCSWDKWHLFWLLVYRELRPLLPKSGQRIVGGGVVCWIWAVFPLPHSSAQKSLGVCGFSESFSPRAALSFLSPLCSGECGRGSQGTKLLFSCHKNKRGPGEPLCSSWWCCSCVPDSSWGAAPLPLLSLMTGVQHLPWELLLVNWAEGECRRGWGEGTTRAFGGTCSHAGGVLLLSWWCPSVALVSEAQPAPGLETRTRASRASVFYIFS